MAAMAKDKACYRKQDPDVIMAVSNTGKGYTIKPMMMFYSPLPSGAWINR